MTIAELFQSMGLLDDDLHKHKCGSCQCVWEHSRAKLEAGGELEKGHECPGCGREQYNMYFGPDRCHTVEEVNRLKEVRA